MHHIFFNTVDLEGLYLLILKCKRLKYTKFLKKTNFNLTLRIKIMFNPSNFI